MKLKSFFDDIEIDPKYICGEKDLTNKLDEMRELLHLIINNQTMIPFIDLNEENG